MAHFKDMRVQIGVVVLAMAAITAIRIAVDEPGPLYFLPVILAGLWLGRWAGLVTGIACAALFALTRELNPREMSGSVVLGTLTRLAAYGGVGFLIGPLADRETRLRKDLGERDRALEELREVQLALTPPEPPDRPALELATCYLPAEHGVSGDFHAVVPAGDGATMIAIGDVAGRGIEAAKRSWYVRTLLISSAEVVTDPGAILERANQSLVEESGYGSFITAVCMLFHPDGRLEWAVAGHDPPLRLGDGAPLASEAQNGLPLGVADRLGCVTADTTLRTGDGALLYTDGLTEARRRGDGSGTELFGQQRVADLLAGMQGQASTDVVNRVRDEVRAFSAGALADDLCLVALRRARVPDSTEVC